MKKKFLHTVDVLVLVAFTIYVLLDAFLIPRAYDVVDTQSTLTIQEDSNEDIVESIEDVEEVTPSTEIISTDRDYQDENVSIHIEEYEYLDTTIYVADVQVSSIEHLQSVFANNTYGKNITDKTSSIASSADAILAINGDFYGARESGYVLRNGVIYRSSASNNEDLLITNDGNFQIFSESDTSLESIASDAYQVYSFGPALIDDYEIQVDASDEVGKAMASNPRTAICQVEENHYLFVVSDGRTNESEGLSLLELAEFLQTLNVKVAYNLDGGGSSTMVFNGQVINNPTTSGNRIKERSVSDVIIIR